MFQAGPTGNRSSLRCSNAKESSVVVKTHQPHCSKRVRLLERFEGVPKDSLADRNQISTQTIYLFSAFGIDLQRSVNHTEFEPDRSGQALSRMMIEKPSRNTVQDNFYAPPVNRKS